MKEEEEEEEKTQQRRVNKWQRSMECEGNEEQAEEEEEAEFKEWPLRQRMF